MEHKRSKVGPDPSKLNMDEPLKKDKKTELQNEPSKPQNEPNNPREMGKQVLIGKHKKHKEQREPCACLKSAPSIKNHQKRNGSEEASVLH
eukprot:9248861-Ditylum_brightwellii.AAC.1